MKKALSLPKWEDFPESTMFNKEMANYINDRLSALLEEDNQITNTMIQNYVKWDMIPKPIGRKYGKIHLAMLFAITMLKEVLPIQDIKKGIDLSLELMSPDKAYNRLVDIVEEAFANISNSIRVEGDVFHIDGFSSTEKSFAIDSAVYSLVLKLFIEDVLRADGLQNYIKEQNMHE